MWLLMVQTHTIIEMAMEAEGGLNMMLQQRQLNMRLRRMLSPMRSDGLQEVILFPILMEMVRR